MNRLIILAALAASSSARADDHPWSLDLETQARWFGDTSAAIVSTEPLAGPRFTVARHLTDVDVPRRTLSISGLARTGFGITEDQIFKELDTELQQVFFTGGLRAEAPLVWRFRLVGEAELGVARTSVLVTGDSGGTVMTPVDDHEWHALGSLSIGTEIAIIDLSQFRLGFAWQVGYTVASPIQLHAYPGDRPDESLSMRTMYGAIGDLDTRGWTFAGGLRGSF